MTCTEIALCIMVVMSLFQTILLLLIALSMVGLFFHRIREMIPEVEGSFEDGVRIPSREDLPTNKPREQGW